MMEDGLVTVSATTYYNNTAWKAIIHAFVKVQDSAKVEINLYMQLANVTCSTFMYYSQPPCETTPA